MLNAVELFQTGDLGGLVVGLEQLVLVVRKLTRNLGGIFLSSLHYACITCTKLL